MFLFKHQRSDRFSFDVEILFLARKADLRIEEVAINWTNVAGSKVNLITDALSMFRDIFRFRVMHRGITPESFVAFKDAEAAPSYS
jgi:dolichyl-phosphate beta-glucosyltransferase